MVNRALTIHSAETKRAKFFVVPFRKRTLPSVSVYIGLDVASRRQEATLPLGAFASG
jgi:hypothetical protein